MSTVLTLVTLRPGTVADLGLVDRLMGESFDPRFGEAWTRNQCLGILAMPGVSLTIADLGGEPAGFALTRRILDEAELLLLATHPAARRRGVAAALLRSVTADCLAAGGKRIYLEVREKNDAIKLYRASGFSKIGERRDYYRGPDGESFRAFTFSRNIV